GSTTASTGGVIAGAGALVTQADSPLPGPADVIGGGMIIGGVATAAVGGAAYAAGSIGGAIDYFR
ncbi:MAG: hypothetical protein ABJM83_20780, partial [Paracoccaceae bacterium]